MLRKNIALVFVVLALSSCTKEINYIPSYYGQAPSGEHLGEAALPDGSRYQGAFKDGLFHGQGSLTWTNKAWYKGEFKQGLFNGKGEMQTFIGDRYTGNFKEGAFSGDGKLVFSFGDIYEGEFLKDNPHGQGVYTSDTGDVFSGEFSEGNFTGKGTITYRNGNVYTGYVKDWLHEGEGKYTFEDGKTYEGEFSLGQPNGDIKLTYVNGDSYEGGMQGWDVFHGDGRYMLSNGDTYEGEFDQGRPTGEFLVTTEAGDHYKGELNDWLYHGKGLLKSADGSVYDGEFEYGQFQGEGTLVSPEDVPNAGKYIGSFSYGTFHGQGTLEYKDESGESKILAGRWRMGKYTGEDADKYAADGIGTLNIEKLLYDQPEKMNNALQKVAKQQAGETDLYFVGFGSHSPQDVFMNDVKHSVQVMEENFGISDRSLLMINNHATLEETPLATTTNLKKALKGVAEKMDVEEDILFLYLTSHGSEDHELSIDMDTAPLQQLPPERLKAIIEESGIKWKVILVSACFSGGFVEPLKDDYSLIITAASADRPSFGCSNDAELTYFGEAFFKDAIGQRDSFTQAFELAKEIVTKREEGEDYLPSNPQINSGALIIEKLAQLKRSASPADICLDGASGEKEQELDACKK